MVRSAHIRVERVAFIAALNTRLVTFKNYEDKFDAAMTKHKDNVKAVEDKHNAAVKAWADKIKEEGLFTYRVYGSRVDLVVDPKHEAKCPQLERGYDNWPQALLELEAASPDKYSRFAVREIENTVSLLELSVDDTVSTYTYGNVAQYL